MSTGPDTAAGTRALRPGQRSEVWVASVTTGARELIFTSDALLLEAPNCAPDDSALILNGTGTLFGGQGTFNVNSWSPDSTRLAYVAYPVG